MTNCENSSEIFSIKNSDDKKSMKDCCSKDEYSTKFNECISKISTINKDNNLDRITENTILGNESKQNCSNRNSTKMNENENDSFWELKSPKNNIYKSGQLYSEFDTIKNNNNIININKEMILEIENDFNNNTNKIKDNSINDKKKIFKVVYPYNFIIFNRGNFNSCQRQLNKQIISIRKPKKFFISKNVLLCNNKEKKITRKNNADNIRKKIKARFLKNLKNTINEKLKLAGSKYFFNFLPQKFICNISKAKNKILMDLTFKELFSKNFCEEKKTDNANYKKYEDNLFVLNYLENNKEIGEKSKYNIFKNMKYYEIFDEYIYSKEFEMEIERLRRKKENYKYINQYIKLASYFIDFFYQ